MNEYREMIEKNEITMVMETGCTEKNEIIIPFYNNVII
jgi:hypothetical protein